MKRRSFFAGTAIAAGAAGAGVLACATSVESLYEPSDTSTYVPESVVDGSGDGGDAGDAEPCTDCEDFPQLCTPDALCPAGLFDPNTPKGGDRLLPLATTINAIAARGPNDLWVAGTVGKVARFDGKSWAPANLGTDESMQLLWLFDSGELVFGSSILRFFLKGLETPDGATVTPTDAGWNGVQLSSEQYGSYHSVNIVTSVSTAPGAQWTWISMWSTPATGLSRMRRLVDGTFAIEPYGPDTIFSNSNFITGVHGHSPDVVWAVGEKGIAFRMTGADGDAPTMDTRSDVFDSQTANQLNGVWAPSDSDAWAVGAGTIVHYKVGSHVAEVVQNIPANVNLRAVTGTSSSDIWAVGDAAVVYHYDGQAWSRVKVAGLGARRPDLRAVHAVAPGTVWIGGKGIVLSLGGGA